MLKKLVAAPVTSSGLKEIKKSAEAQELVSAVMTSAYLLEETEISNADVSIYVEEAGGSTQIHSHPLVNESQNHFTNRSRPSTMTLNSCVCSQSHSYGWCAFMESRSSRSCWLRDRVCTCGVDQSLLVESFRGGRRGDVGY
ncbi:F-box protein [Dorcoceras hygrometricum]|uniref:F-box protein n=1 Tax=Dorcoceras hygrometricum TaxID=472368 RepID=A0A2Z7CAD8_9LAMI|nr:F-box protein [Dorcoceras hygrometricum]